MSFLRNHIVLMFVYAAATGAFFAVRKGESSERLRTFLIIFCALFLGGIALGWLMYPFPVR